MAAQVFDILTYLIGNRDRVVSKDDLIGAVWDGRIVSDSALTTRLKVVRDAIGDSGNEQRLIKTLPRKGFRFVGVVREEHTQAATPTAISFAASGLPGDLSDRPSIVVLPFINLSSAPNLDVLVEGVTEDVLTELSKLR